MKVYKIHFGSSKRSKFYPQALELAEFAYEHEIAEDGKNQWHTVTLTKDQLDLMFHLYRLALKLPKRTLYGADIQYLAVYCNSGGTFDYVHASGAFKKRVNKAAERLQEETGKSLEEISKYLRSTYQIPVMRDHQATLKKLISSGLVESLDVVVQKLVPGRVKAKEPVPVVGQIKRHILEKEYVAAIEAYYEWLGEKPFGKLTPELIYLKRIANYPLEGRDLLYFKPESSQSELIVSNLDEYKSCIDEALADLEGAGRQTPIDILIENSPTMEEKIEERKNDWNNQISYLDGKWERDKSEVSINSFSDTYDAVPSGRLFKAFPDQVKHCNVYEYEVDPQYQGLWIEYSPDFYRRKVLDKGLHLGVIEAYRHKDWRYFRGKWKNENDFTTIRSMKETTGDSIHVGKKIEYTGRAHRIGMKLFYEINTNRKTDGKYLIGNPFEETVDEVLREAENRLREKHGLPRIGEGWISEIELLNMVRGLYPDEEVIHQASPGWLGLQRLDIFIPERKLAIEYQGKQHFEPVDFFGGEEGYKRNQERDARKLKLCKKSGISLIYFNYDEEVTEDLVKKRVDQAFVQGKDKGIPSPAIVLILFDKCS